MVAVTLAFLAVLLVTGSALAQQPAQTLTLKLADSLPPTHYGTVNASKP